VISTWGAALQFGHITQLETVLETHAARNAPGIAFIQVIEDETPPLEISTRPAVARMLQRHTSKIRCAAFVVGGTGFGAAAARAVITSVLLMSKTNFPQVVFSNVITAANWVDRHLNAGPQLSHATELNVAITLARQAARLPRA
jgi:hypothetical protein